MGEHGHGHGDRAAPRGVEPLDRDTGRGRILFLDAFSGIAGDMLVAALLDLGVPERVVRDAVAALDLEEAGITVGSRTRSGIVGRSFEVRVAGDPPQRTHRDIRALLWEADLPEGARDRALAAFERLAEAEAAVHGTAVSDVHFHEVGAVDSIVDVVAACAALDHLGAEVVCSPLPLGHGTIPAQHGPLPLPAPATVLCLRGVPTYDGGAEAELVTPTGACLVATAASRFERWPSCRPDRVGWGAGTRELPDRPNLLRAVLGEPSREAVRNAGTDPFVVLECNVDDTTGEIVAHAVECLLAAGALDAWTIPIGMKKGRPAVMICALTRRAGAEELSRVLLSETSTLGVRLRPSRRIERPRRIVEVDTRYGPIPVKIADGDGLPPNVAPELEVCRRIAAARRIPLKQVLAAALAAARRGAGSR